MTKGEFKAVRKLARRLGATAGHIWVCVDCSYSAKRVHDEKWARYIAIEHVDGTGHTVRVLELK